MDDYVSFYIGCSFSFEEALMDAGIQLQHIIDKRNVPMYRTNIPCVRVVPFDTPIVVSMRPIPKDLVEKAVIITAAYEAVHGAPIHIGDPSVIGIEEKNIDPSDVGDLVTMFWGCGATSSIAVRSAKPPLSFSHAPGSSFVCDITVEEHCKTHKPEHGEEEPRLVTLTDRPFLASVCSASAFQKVEEVAKLLPLESPVSATKRGQDSDFMKIAARLSHAPSVVVGFLCEKENLSSQSLDAALVLIKALQALKKNITIVTQYHGQLIRDCVTTKAVQAGVSREGIRVVELKEAVDIQESIFPDKINHRLDAMIAFQAEREHFADEDGNEGDLEGNLVETLFKEASSCENKVVSITISADGRQTSGTGDDNSVDHHALITSCLKTATSCLSGALYVLNNCPIHSRYVRRGVGKRQIYEAEQFLLNDEEGVSSQIVNYIQDN